MDRAGKDYWDKLWDMGSMPVSVNPDNKQLSNYVNRRFHEYFHEVFDAANNGAVLLEIGCAKSVWLPYFAKEFGFEIWGLDYSPIGCEQTKQMLLNCGVDGRVICSNLFEPPKHMLESFDIVISFGVLEHFEDTVKCLAAFGRFLKPGGLLITNIPNMTGAVGFLQKTLNRSVFDIHVPLDAEFLRKAHKNAGYEVLKCDYFLSTSNGVCSLNGLPTASISSIGKKIVLALLARSSMLLWWIELKIGPFRATKWASPYINVVARKLA